LVAVFSALGGVTVVHASDVGYVPLAPIDVPGSEFTSPGYGTNAEFSKCQAPTCFPRYLRTIYNIGIVLAGLFAVVSIVRGGFELMFTDSILGRSEGKGMILRALGGLLVVYSSYILMNMINPALGRDLDLALQFPHITLKKEVSTLMVVTAADVEEQLNKQLDTVNPQIRQLVNEREAKLKLAEEKMAAAARPGISPALKAELEAEAATLRAEAAILDNKQKFLGDVNAPSERIKKANLSALNHLWESSTTWTLERTATRQQRIDEATRQLEVMENERANINLLPLGSPEREALLKELNDTKTALVKQIEYFEKGCGNDGLKLDPETGLRGPCQ
jgi:hypothetical protein